MTLSEFCAEHTGDGRRYYVGGSSGFFAAGYAEDIIRQADERFAKISSAVSKHIKMHDSRVKYLEAVGVPSFPITRIGANGEIEIVKTIEERQCEYYKTLHKEKENLEALLEYNKKRKDFKDREVINVYKREITDDGINVIIDHPDGIGNAGKTWGLYEIGQFWYAEEVPWFPEYKGKKEGVTNDESEVQNG